MTALLIALCATLRSSVRSRLALEAEILALRHQLAVLQRQTPSRAVCTDILDFSARLVVTLVGGSSQRAADGLIFAWQS